MANNKIIAHLRANHRTCLSKTALIDDTKQVSYQELWADVDRYATLFQEQHIGPGKVVVLSFPNSIDLCVSLLAIMQLGAVPLIVNDVQENTIDFQALNVYGFLIHKKSTHSIFYKQAVQQMGSSAITDFVFFPNEHYQPSSPVAAALLLTSSGSTSHSKVVQLSAQSILKNIKANAASLGIQASDITIVALPMNYSYGLIGQFLSHLLKGCTLVLTDTKFAITQIPKLIQKYRATSLFTVPPMVRQINYWHDKGFYQGDFSSLRFVTVGGNHIERSSLVKAMKLFKCRFIKTYGLAEAGPRVSTNVIDAVTSDEIDSVGMPIPGVTIEVVDDNGKPVPAGQEGTVLITSPSVMIGYLNADMPEKTIPHQHILTKDRGYLSASGKLSVLGRMGDSIEVSGKTVWFNQIADVIYSTGQILKLTLSKEGNKVRIVAIPMGRCKITEEAISLILCENFHVDAWSSFEIEVVGSTTVGIVK